MIGEDPKRAADGLCEVLIAIEAVDYNALIDKDLYRLLEAKLDILEMCLRYRRDQRGVAARARDAEPEAE